MVEHLLSDGDLDKIENQLPDLSELSDQAFSYRPDLLSSGYFAHESEVPIAGVSFIDCVQTLYAARYALHEYLVHRTYYREVKSPPEEHVAAFLERFYLDDTALRLYSAAEHLVDGVIKMLEIVSTDLPKGGVSSWIRVMKYLKRRQPNEDLTRAMLSLAATPQWKCTIRYRGAWVHNQPPTVHGLGIVYQRRKRWETSQDGKTKSLVIAQGDQPEFTTEQLGQAFMQAFSSFLAVVRSAFDRYERILVQYGFSYSAD